MSRFRRAIAASIVLATALAFTYQFSSRLAAAPLPATALAQARTWVAKALEPASKRVPVLRRIAQPVRLAQSGGGTGIAPWVQTDDWNYLPGETALITGGGFVPGDVFLQVKHADGTVEGGAGHLPWPVTAGPDGSIASQWFVTLDDSLGSTFLLTADQPSSGLHAEYTFQDANPAANL